MKKSFCRLCGNDLGNDMNDAIRHLMIDHDAEPNEDFIREE